MGSLSSIQHAIMIGSLLGDGTLRKQGTRTNALFEVNHSFEYRTYVDWKYSTLKEFVLTPPKSRLGNGTRVAYRFTTRSLPIFTEYYHWFYADSKKRIPSDVRLDPLSLAVWFMDDGAKSRTSYYLNTQQFTFEEQVLLQKFLLNSFQLNTTLNKDKHYWRIRVSTESSKRMNEIIIPFIRPCFRYKLTL